VNKRILTLIADMGFTLAEPDPVSNYHHMLKQTDKHLIIVKYEVRSPVLLEEPKEPEADSSGML